MKQLSLLTVFLWLTGASLVQAAEAPDELFVRYYQMIQQADALLERKQEQAAMAHYLKAREGLQGMQKAFPSWNQRVIEFRLDYLGDKLKPLVAKFGESAPAQPAPARPAPGKPSQPDPTDSQIQVLNQQIIELRIEREKLRKQLSSTPSEKDLVQAKSEMERLRQQNSELQSAVKTAEQKSANMVDAAVVEAMRKELQGMVPAETHQGLQTELQERTELVNVLTQENEELLKRVRAADDDSRAARLRAENRGLRAEIARLNSLTRSTGKIEKANEVLAGRVERLQDENTMVKAQLQGEKDRARELEKRLEEAAAGKDKTIQRLTRENEKLNQQLASLSETEIPALRSENAGLKQQVGELEKRISGADKVRKQNDSLTAANAELKSRNEALDSELKSTRTELAKASKDNVNESLQKDLEKMNRELVRQAEALASVSSENEDLEAENKSLRGTLQRDQRRMAKMVAASQVSDLRRQLEQTERELTRQIATAGREPSDKNLRQAQETLAQQEQQVARLKAENAKLEALLNNPAFSAPADAKPDPDATAKIRELEAENRRLEKAIENATEDNPFRMELAAARSGKRASDAALSSLRRDIEKLDQRNTRLESEVGELREVARNSADAARNAKKVKELEAEREELRRQLKAAEKMSRERDAKRIAKLEQERNELQEQLRDASRKLASSDPDNGNVAQMADQLANLRARLEVLEARKVPYSAEELALFNRKPEPVTEAPAPMPQASRRQTTEFSASAKDMLADAQRDFALRRYAAAEKKYKTVLEEDRKNVFTLSNLAATQIEQNRLDEAEKNLDEAMAIDSSDAHTLFQYGYLKYRQSELDEALTLLGQAATANPENSDVQNYLGIVLSEKGQRGAAESALLKAIQLSPGNASAHHNLAVIYATQTPPLPELANWHYEKAREAGHPRNEDLEALIKNKSN